jgi:hypothetical protein
MKKEKFSKMHNCSCFMFIRCCLVAEIIAEVEEDRRLAREESETKHQLLEEDRLLESSDKNLTLVTVLDVENIKLIEILIKNTEENLKLLKQCHFIDLENKIMSTLIDFEEVEVRYFVTDSMYTQYYIADKLLIKDLKK